RLQPGIDRARITLYAPVDCHTLLPTLYQTWSALEASTSVPLRMNSGAVRITDQLREELEIQSTKVETVLEGAEEDRPPVVDICVGRAHELQQLQMSPAKVIFLTGVGGQGKSTLAAKYFTDCQSQHKFSFYTWRDCKEESERFENQLASVVEGLSRGKILA